MQLKKTKISIKKGTHQTSNASLLQLMHTVPANHSVFPKRRLRVHAYK